MIFVTVGTTLPFDDLIRHVDHLVESGALRDPVVCQIGTGKYRPRHCRFFTFQPSLDPWYRRASVVVAHGGTGTVLELLRMQKPFVAVANPLAVDDHQVQFLSKLESVDSVLWCRELTDLPGYIREARRYRARGLPFHSLALHLMERIEKEGDGKVGEPLGRVLTNRFMSRNGKGRSA
ncbi:MAG: glucuronosyltransferase [Desulfacinum sp.]|jgi:beta-1,4-N-acetylglucosaminyltransferase|nr:glucuronosyltransferase [Desulfacinum sp.]MBZ4658427.1 N-acetylglucosaminyldiphosphodolichol N-acetylglucosaminyltransferase [Desulfacinum sp.]